MTPKADGGDAQRTRFQTGTESPPTLADLGITKNTSARSQQLAALAQLEAEQAGSFFGIRRVLDG